MKCMADDLSLKLRETQARIPGFTRRLGRRGDGDSDRERQQRQDNAKTMIIRVHGRNDTATEFEGKVNWPQRIYPPSSPPCGSANKFGGHKYSLRFIVPFVAI